MTLQYYYDSVNNLVREIDQDGREFLSEFDTLGRAVHRVDPYGNEWRLAYDKEANLVRLDRQELIKDPTSGAPIGSQHYAETYIYDELNRRVARATPTGMVHHAYDSRGDCSAITDPLGNVVRNEYDIFQRVTRSRQFLAPASPGGTPQAVEVSFTYDLDDQKVSQTTRWAAPRASPTTPRGGWHQRSLPDGSADLAEYDAAGNMVAYHDRNGIVRRLAWDALGRNSALQVDRSGLVPGLELGGASNLTAEFECSAACGTSPMTSSTPACATIPSITCLRKQ